MAVYDEVTLAEAEASGYRKGREDCERADVPALLDECDILRVDLAICKSIRADLERQLVESKARSAELEAQLRSEPEATRKQVEGDSDV